MLMLELDGKLNKAISVTLIADIWKSNKGSSYMGLSAKLSLGITESEIIVIGFERMIENHSHNEVKKSIEDILAKYSFDKKKIIGNDI